MSLNARQKKFVLAYCRLGVGKTAAIEAGYSARSAEAQASVLLSDQKVSKAIRDQADSSRSNTIADIAELREWWSKLLRGVEEGADMKDRLKASDLLGKSQGAFLDRVDHSSSDGTMSPAVIVLPAKDG